MTRLVTGPDGARRFIELLAPSPVAFIIQELLSMGDRQSRPKRERDLLYMADAMLLFGDVLSSIVEAERSELAPSLFATDRTTIRTKLKALGTVGDLHRGAALQARDAGMSPLDDAKTLAMALSDGAQPWIVSADMRRVRRPRFTNAPT